MDVAIVGLGLIGGSMARAVKACTDSRVLSYNRTAAVLERAMAAGAIDGKLTDENLGACDIVIVALYPGDTVSWIISHRDLFKKGALVFDCCGVKRAVTEPLEQLSLESGFTFVGAHPMAGTERVGFDYSSAAMFKGASFIATPYSWTPPEAIERLRRFVMALGFGLFQLSDPGTHDHLIAYTSQLAHVVSCAYVGSPSAPDFRGFSAGSFQDMTRVARLNENMWSELFVDNSDYLSHEIETLAARLLEFSAAVRGRERQTLERMLGEARVIKERIDPRD